VFLPCLATSIKDSEFETVRLHIVFTGGTVALPFQSQYRAALVGTPALQPMKPVTTCFVETILSDKTPVCRENPA